MPKTIEPAPTKRTILPQRRPSENLAFEHEGVPTVGTFSRDANGRLVEVFLRAGKPGSAADKVAQDSAIILSLALQHNTPLTVIRHALQKLRDGSSAGPVGRFLDLIEGDGNG